MSDVIAKAVARKNTKKNFPQFRAGDTVEVSVLVKEGEKERTQLYKGVVVKLTGHGVARSFTVRKISDGVGVERTFPFTSPIVEKVQVIAQGKVRRAKLYYLRKLEGKAAKLESELVAQEDTRSAEEIAAEAAVKAARKAELAKSAGSTKKKK